MRKPLIYLDNCALGRSEDPPSNSKILRQQMALEVILAAVSRDELVLVCSTWNQDEAKQDDDPSARDKKLVRINLATEKVDAADSINLAEQLMLAPPRYPHRLRLKDALHLAAALARNVDYFITGDDGLWKWGRSHASPEVLGRGRIVPPQEFVGRLRHDRPRGEEE